MSLKLEFFPPEIIALKEEIDKHPVLRERLAGQEEKDFYVQLSEIAAHCGILLDGTFTPADIVKLSDMLIKKLMSMRSIIILPSSVIH